jgi:cytochrome c556
MEKFPMIRALIAVVAVTVGVGAVVAQDLAADRKAVMKASGKNMVALSKMIKGDDPYNQATVDAALAQFDDKAKRLVSLFPESAKASVAGSGFSASPKIWDNKAGFEAEVAKFGAAVTKAKATVKNLDTLKAEQPAINAVCTSCHEGYRVRN